MHNDPMPATAPDITVREVSIPNCPEHTLRRWASRQAHDGVTFHLRRRSGGWVELSAMSFARVAHRSMSCRHNTGLTLAIVHPKHQQPPPV
jgi:hypothetical protein